MLWQQSYISVGSFWILRHSVKPGTDNGNLFPPWIIVAAMSEMYVLYLTFAAFLMLGWVGWHHLSPFLILCRRTVASGGWHGGRRWPWAQGLHRNPPALPVTLLPLQGTSSVPAQEHLRRRSPGHGLWLQLRGWGWGQVEPWLQGQAEEEVCKFHFHPSVCQLKWMKLLYILNNFVSLYYGTFLTPCYQIQNYWIAHLQRCWNAGNTFKKLTMQLKLHELKAKNKHFFFISHLVIVIYSLCFLFFLFITAIKTSETHTFQLHYSCIIETHW